MNPQPTPQKGTENSADTPRRGRSAQYPVIALDKAIEYTQKVWNTQRKQEAHVDATLKAMGYTSQSGSAMRALSALKQYGLALDSGEGDKKRIRLSEIGMNVLLPESDQKREKALVAAALSPAINKVLWNRYGKILPSDVQIIPLLTHEKNYHDEAATEIIRNYRQSFLVAKLDKWDGHSSDDDQERSDEKPVEERSDRRTPLKLNTDMHEMPVPISPTMVAHIPFPMTEDDFNFLLSALNLYKVKLLTQPQPNPQEGLRNP